MDLYTVITADIIRSKSYNNLEKNIDNKLKKLNKYVKINYPFTNLKGDEIQGVFKEFLPENFSKSIRSLRFFMLPYRLKIGVGIGNISSPMNSNNPWELNGEAFHFAREALNFLENEKLSRNTFIKSNLPGLNEILNSLFLLMDSIQNEWTEAQWEAIHAYEDQGTYKNAAELLNIAYQNVEKRCSAANWKVYSETEASITRISDMYREGKILEKGNSK